MKSSALVFLAAFIALSASWGGFVLTPQIQLGREGQSKTLGLGELYPQARPGRAQQGLQVYRANGCVYCHSQQVGQTETMCEIVLTEAGTNTAAVLTALVKIGSAEGITSLPKTILQVADVPMADPIVKALRAAGAKADVRIVPTGPDLARGWGVRRSVAQDYLFDNPVQPGTRRIGPDLANVGARMSDANWQLLHLYAPAAVVPGSPMPPYRFLFETRKLGFNRQPSPNALPLTGDLAPATGYEVVPRPEAQALVAYLLSLRADAPLFDAPMTPPVVIAAATNAPAK
jgi:cbb3-type cytochrome oxidase cytochrome c subunit